MNQLELELPQHILLLHLYQLHLTQARQLTPRLTIRPSYQYTPLGKLHYIPHPTTPNSDIEQAQLSSAISTYRRHISISIACLRSIISLADQLASPSAPSIPIELNLFARSQLVQILIGETKEYQLAHQITQHALNLSRQRDSLTPFKLSLSESLVTILAADPQVSFRQIKKQIERCIQLTLKNQTVDSRLVSWYYRFQLLLCHMSYERAKDFPTAIAALRNMINLAESRNDRELWIACKVHEVKLAMDRHEWGLVGQLFDLIIPLIDLPNKPSGPSPQLTHPLDTPQAVPPLPPPPRPLIMIGQQLKNYLVLLLIVYYLTVGQSESAKWWLKHLRNEMDSPTREEGEAEGTYKIYLQSHSPQNHIHYPAQISPINTTFHLSSTVTPRKRMYEDDCKSPSSPQLSTHKSFTLSGSTSRDTQYVMISIMPRELMYTLTYLVSLAVHFDGHGKSPKSLVYAQEGLKQVDRQLTLGFQFLTQLSAARQPDPLSYSPSILSSMNVYLDVLMNIKTEINIMSTQIAIVRSDFLHADQLLVEIIKTVCEQDRWDLYSPRISFLKSMLSNATGNLPSARQSLLTTLFLANRQLKTVHPPPVRLGFMAELGTLAKACYVLIRLAETDGCLSSTDLDSDTQLAPPAADLSRSFAVDRLIHELSSLAKVSLPNVYMAIQVVLAISCGEIVKAKHHLTSALNEANKTSNTHLKMILLGLLSTMFLNTRSDQATKMLKSCYKLAQGFSSNHQLTSQQQHAPLQSRPALENLPGDVSHHELVVGNSSLALCVGRKLVEIYEFQSSLGGCGENGSEGGADGDKIDRQQNELRKDRLILANMAYQRVLNQTPLL